MADRYRNWLRTLGAPEDPTATDTTSDWSAMSLLKAIYAQLGSGIVNAVLAPMAQATFKMRAAGSGTGVPIDGTPLQARTALSDAVVPLVSNTTIAASHLGQTLTVSGYFTLAMTAAATLGSAFWFDVYNIGSRRVLIDPSGAETIDGATTVGLYPGQGCRVFCNGSAFYTEGRPRRWRQNTGTTLTLYASLTTNTPAGSADNDGLAASAPMTPAAAQEFIRSGVEQAGLSVTIQLADGSYNTAEGFSQFAGDWFGHHNIEIWGNSADVGEPASVTLAPTNSGDTALYVTDKCRVVVRYIKYAGHASSNHVKVEQFAVVGEDHCSHQGCNVAVLTRINGQYKTNGVCYFGGTHAATFQSTEDGCINIGASTHVVATGYVCTTCAVANGGTITVDPGASFNKLGTHTGTRYTETNGGQITGNSASLFPGDVAGTTTEVEGPTGTRTQFGIPSWDANGVLQNTGASATVAGAIEAAAAQYIGWGARSVMKSPSDGVITLFDQAGSTFGRMQFGGTTSSFPAIKRTTTALNFRLADDSADAAITVGAITSTGLLTTSLAGNAARFVNTTDSASVQVLRLEGDRATMADADAAYVSFMLSDDGGTQSEFGRQTWSASDVNAGTSIDGAMTWGVAVAGTLTDYIRLDGTIFSPAATGIASLGSNTRRWASLDMSSGGFIRFNGTDILTHSAGILTLDPGDFRVATAGTNTASVVTVGGTQTLTGKTLGAVTLGGTVSGGGNQLNNIIIGTSTPLAGTFTALTSTGNTILGDASGDTVIVNAKSITKPNGVIVNAFNGSTITNVTGDGTSYQLLFGTEAFDRGSDFASPTFTAPITGAYHVSLNLVLLQIDATHTAISVTMVCTGKTYTLFSANAGALQVSGVVAVTCGLAAVSLTANDTITFSIVVSGGAAGKVVDYYGAADGTGSSVMIRLVG